MDSDKQRRWTRAVHPTVEEIIMKRRAFDIIASTVGLGLAALLIVAGGLLTWAHNFVQDEVHSQLSAQQIYFPTNADPELKQPEFAAVRQYEGQQLTSGDQAEVYADHFIANHLKAIGGGQTYAQLSAKALANPTDVKLQAQVATMFKGETLRGLLLNAYAFGKMGTIAGIAAVAAFVGGGLMLILGALGLWHSRRVPATAQILSGRIPDAERIP
jgi:hypothetical protein